MYKLFSFKIDTDADGAASQPPQAVATKLEVPHPGATVKPLTELKNVAVSKKSLVANYIALDPTVLEAFE